MNRISLLSKNILACFVGSLIALTLFVGIAYGIDKLLERRDVKGVKSLNEKVLTYFDEKGISCEKKDTMLYAFLYKDTRYIYLYDPEDPNFLRIISSWKTEMKNRNTLLEITNKLELEWKFIKINIDDENDVRFTIEQFVDPQADIDEAFSRCLTVLEKTTGEFFDQLR